MKTDHSARYCDLCGLPVLPTLTWRTRREATADTDGADVEYCCSGCRSVASIQLADQASDNEASSMWRIGAAVFFAMNVMVFTLVLWSREVYAAEAYTGQFAAALHSLFRWGALLFSVPVLLLLGEPIASGVWQALRRRCLTADLLILLGVAAAFLYSTISVLRGNGQIYFEVAAMVLLFVSLGRHLEAKGKLRASASLDQLAALLPTTIRRRGDDGTFSQIASGLVRSGDVIRVLPGERLPVDGEIIQGRAHIDQQVVTGESSPAEKSLGAPVYSGTLNLDGDLQLRVTAANGQETVSRILALVREARTARAAHQQLADRIVYWFLPAVCLIALFSAAWQGAAHGLDQGILSGLAVILIACPCALGLATPLALWTALGRAAQAGVLFRSGQCLEQLAAVRHACFDKTGTLTTGVPRAVRLETMPGEQQAMLLCLAADLAAGSAHGASQAIVALAERSLPEWKATGSLTVETIPGRGVVARHSALGPISLGSRRLMQQQGLEIPAGYVETSSAGDAVSQQVLIGFEGRIRGVFYLQEALRPEALDALDDCRQLGLQIALLTGDEPARAAAIGAQCGVEYQASLLPEQKAAHIEALAQRGAVAMIGDGLNDAPAVAATHLGVALGCGADVTRAAAGVCLLSNDLCRFPWAVGLARQTLRVIKQNLFWAFAYNSIGIVLAATGRLNPIWAALAMAISSLLVVANSLRLGRYPLDNAPPVPTNANVDEMPELNNTASDPKVEIATELSDVLTTEEAVA